MKKYLIPASILIVIAISSFLLLTSFSNPDENSRNKASFGGELSFTVRTVTANGNYSPKHVLAIWIEDIDGFVKSRKVMGSQRKQYLYTWVNASNYNVVDAITGATLSSHQTHSISWDCTDLDGNIVPDGDYVVFAEFTDKHAQGPLYSVTFTKGTDGQFLLLPDETYFKDMVLTFTPLVCEFSANDTDICQEAAVIFTDESENATSWDWDFGDGAVPATADTEGPHTVNYTNSGMKTVSLTINANLTETKENFINVAVKPTADFLFTGTGLTIDFTNASLDATTYFWDFGDGNTSIENNPVHTYSTAGTYLVSMVAINVDCADTNTLEISVPLVGLPENNNEELIRVFPNPTKGRFFIDVKNLKGIKEIRLIALSGQIVQSLYPDNNDGIIRFDLDKAKKGIYFLEILTNTNILTEKVLVR